jgi:predicted XRE-type DNA-binding protein
MAKKTRSAARGTKGRTRKRVRTRAQLNKLIGRRVRAERLRQDLTLTEIADSSGLTNSQVSQVERGINAASVWALVRIADSLGVRVSAFLCDV